MLCKHFVYTCIYMYVHVAEYAHVHVCDTSPSGYMYMCVWYISRTYMHKYKIMSAGINTRGALHVLCFPYVCVLHLAIHVHEHLNIICHSVFSPESAVGSADESSHFKHNGRKPYTEGFLAFCHISPPSQVFMYVLPAEPLRRIGNGVISTVTVKLAIVQLVGSGSLQVTTLGF